MAIKKIKKGKVDNWSKSNNNWQLITKIKLRNIRK